LNFIIGSSVQSGPSAGFLGKEEKADFRDEGGLKRQAQTPFVDNWGVVF